MGCLFLRGRSASTPCKHASPRDAARHAMQLRIPLQPNADCQMGDRAPQPPSRR
ncbi:hypothetical protein C2E23DRAFT_842064 [Lenzites betulinus]|nr:hypothetical protein C2E23DRAFT_842064 [Lenzites betulinus]